jgi:4-amino-4-deoxy-L-arabinose transferase-like glycosyltransferase
MLSTVAAAEPAASRSTRALWMRSGAVVFFLALALRLVAIAELQNVPLFRTPQLDSREYLDWASLLAAFEPVWPADLPHGPGYPLFVALVLRLSGGSLLAVRLVQAVIGATSCLLVYRMARHAWGRAAAICAGIVLAACSPLILIDVSILSEGLLLFLLVAAAALATVASASPGRALACGFLLGYATIVRPTAAIAALVLLAFTVRRTRSAIVAGAFLIGLALPLAPAVAIGAKHAGGLLPVQAKSGFNLYQGISPALTGTASLRPGGPYELVAQEAARRGLHGPEADRYYVRKALEEIREAPGAFVALLGSKALWLVQNVELRDSHSFYFFRAESIVLSVTLPFAALFALAAAGLLTAWRERNAFAPLAWILLLFALSFVVLMVGSRYRMPLVPFLGAYAGLGAARLAGLLRAARFRDAIVTAGVAAAALALSMVRDHPASHQFAEEWAWTGQSLLREGNPAAARDAFLRALEDDPRSSRALVGLAGLAMRAGDGAAAERLVARAAIAGPNDPMVHYRAGELAWNRGDWRMAAREFGRASWLLPDWGEARIRQAEASVRANDLADAERAWRSVIALFEQGLVGAPAGEQARVWRRLAEVLARRGKAGEAQQAVARAAELARQAEAFR